MPSDDHDPLHRVWPVVRGPLFAVDALLKHHEQSMKTLERLSLTSFRMPTLPDLTRISESMSSALRAAEERQRAFAEALPRHMETYEHIHKTMESLCDPVRLKSITESIASASTRAIAMAERMAEYHSAFSGFVTDRVIVKDFVLDQEDMPIASEEIILEDLVLEPQEIQLADAPPSVADEVIEESAERKKDATPAVSAPAFLQTLTVDLEEKFYEFPPADADYLDETIALYEPHKAGIFILTTCGWRKEEKRVGKQSIRLIQYVRRIAKRTGNPCATLTELSEHLTKRAMNPDHARSSISNRIQRIQQICEQYNCKPILIKSGGLWRINPALTRWDAVNYLPPVHR